MNFSVSIPDAIDGFALRRCMYIVQPGERCDVSVCVCSNTGFPEARGLRFDILCRRHRAGRPHAAPTMGGRLGGARRKGVFLLDG